jgi:hypothetical protein
MIKKISILGLISFLFFIGFTGSVFAQPVPPAAPAASDCTEYCSDPYDPTDGSGAYSQPANAYCICPATSSTNLDDLLDSIINYIFWFATAITPILILAAAFLFMTAAGDPNKVQRAKRMIIYILAGYAIVLFARGLVYVLGDILGA